MASRDSATVSATVSRSRSGKNATTQASARRLAINRSLVTK
jgi:hypothetical protein